MNQTFSLNQQNRLVSIPVAHSSAGYAFLFNLPSFGRVSFSHAGANWTADAVLQADFWVSTTSDSSPHATSPWGQLQAHYADATGHAPVYVQQLCHPLNHFGASLTREHG